MAIYMLK